MKLILSTLCMLLSTIVWGQTEQNGFIVTRAGDTLQGVIERKGNSISITSDDKNVTIPLSAVRQYKNGKKIHSIYTGTLYPFNDNLDRDNYRIDISSYDTSLALITIYSTPKMNLLEGHDSYRRTYFFVQRPSDPMPVQMMVSFQYQAQHSSSVAINLAKVQQVQIKTYVAQLKMLTEGCKIPEKEWDFMDYRSYSFKRIIQLYNRCD